MFVCNSDGIYMPALRPPGTVPAGDPNTLQVRARRRRDLAALRRNYLPELGPTIELAGTDYEYRAYCTPEQWGQALAKMAESIDYVKFKSTARDPELLRAYERMWSTILTALSPRYSRQRAKEIRQEKARSLAWSHRDDKEALPW